jgi:monoterpene epsilon-lactone hydrolase
MVTWVRDDRPASWYTRLYVRGMRLMRDKQAFTGARHTLHVARSRQREGSRPPTRWTRLETRTEQTRIAGTTVWSVQPRRAEPVVRVVYVHGGGYVHPLTTDYWRLVRQLVRTPARVIVPFYPLAPDATAEQVIPVLLDVLRETAEGSAAPPTVLMGDSAGGALVLEMGRLSLRDDRARLAGIVALSPWLDATLAEHEVGDLEPTDPMLAESGLRAAARWWAGDRDPADPLISPVNASLTGLPPIDVFIGDRDILRPAVDALAARADAEGAELHVHEVSAMFHVWMTRAIPEGRRTRRALVELLRQRARGD